MAYPWLKKNRLMSLWLSSANAAAGRARGHASAAMNRQKAAMTRQGIRFWTSAWMDAVKPKRHR